jgi:LDH2 family malate/lactate/ureidoglycolate dehydrogenase
MIRYRGLVDSGECQVGAAPSVLRNEGPFVVIDGNRGFGHPAMALAIDTAADTTNREGLAAVAVVQCGHTGRMGAWAERAAAHGMVTLMALAASDPPFALAAAPGTKASLQTNPLTIGVPTADDPLVLDMATSAVAGGKVMVARASGTSLPEGVLIDAEGRPTTDPEDFFNGGALLPAAGHKGFGLGTMVEALSVCLTGADEAGLAPTSGALVICLRADAFRARGRLERSLDALRARIRGSSVTVPVLLPGQPEAESRMNAALNMGEDVHALLLDSVRSTAN